MLSADGAPVAGLWTLGALRTGTLWEVEHGPRGGDEVNLPQPGKNYGWPIVTHGISR